MQRLKLEVLMIGLLLAGCSQQDIARLTSAESGCRGGRGREEFRGGGASADQRFAGERSGSQGA